MNTVKELLLKECDYPLSGEIMDRFLESAEELHLKRNGILIMSGKVDANIYVVKEGILRYSYMNGLREVTYAFSLPGTMIISMFSYYFHLPTFYQIEACCESISAGSVAVFLRIFFLPRSHFRSVSFIPFYSFIREILLYLHYTNP